MSTQSSTAYGLRCTSQESDREGLHLYPAEAAPHVLYVDTPSVHTRLWLTREQATRLRDAITALLAEEAQR